MLLSHFTRSPAPSFAGLGGLNFGALTGFATSFLTMDDMTVSDKKCDTKFNFNLAGKNYLVLFWNSEVQE